MHFRPPSLVCETIGKCGKSSISVHLSRKRGHFKELQTPKAFYQLFGRRNIIIYPRDISTAVLMSFFIQPQRQNQPIVISILPCYAFIKIFEAKQTSFYKYSLGVKI